MIDRKQERSNKFNRKKKFKQKGVTPPKRKSPRQYLKEQ